jgi:sulfur carrier protein ThiS
MTNLKIYIEKEEKTVKIQAITIAQALKKLKLNPTTHLTTVNNELVTESFKPKEKDKIKILPVISGG